MFNMNSDILLMSDILKLFINIMIMFLRFTLNFFTLWFIKNFVFLVICSVIFRDLSRVKYSILWKQGKTPRDKQAFLQGERKSPRRKISFLQRRENFERNKAFLPKNGKCPRRTKPFVQGTRLLREVWSLSSKEREVSERGKIADIYQCIVIAIFPAHVCLWEADRGGSGN